MPACELEHLAGQMRARAEPRRAVVELARIGLGVGDELRKRRDRHLGMHHQDVGQLRHDGDRHELRRIEGEVRHEARADDERPLRRGEQGVAVGLGAGDIFGAEVLRRAGAVLDHDGLAELRGRDAGRGCAASDRRWSRAAAARRCGSGGRGRFARRRGWRKRGSRQPRRQCSRHACGWPAFTCIEVSRLRRARFDRRQGCSCKTKRAAAARLALFGWRVRAAASRRLTNTPSCCRTCRTSCRCRCAPA